jgi:radical SAM protein with 4Fe4S-binding SPASM domain
MEKKKYNFQTIYYEITRRCNLKCKMCMTGSNDETFVKDGLKNELSYDEIVDYILKGGKELGVVQIAFSGGEPLLRGDFLDVLSAAVDLGYESCGIVSNATIITEERIRELKEIAGDTLLMTFGINSISDRNLNKETRDSDLETVLNAIDLCKKNGIRMSIVVNMGHFNRESFGETIDWLTKNKIFFNKSPFIGRNSAKEFFKKMTFTKEDMEKYLNPVLRSHVNGYVSFTPFFLSPEVHKEVSGGESWNVTVPQNPSIGCWVGSWIGIGAEGGVSPCATLIDELDAGNLREKSLYEIIDTSPIFQNILNRDKLEGKCGHCRYKITCGGCRALAYYHTGDYMAEDPTCFFDPKDENTKSEFEEETNRNFGLYAKIVSKSCMYDPSKRKT